MKEQLLISKFSKGDADTFSEIFYMYYKDLVMYAYSFIKDMEEAEEIVQDTFVKLWEDHEKIDVRISLRSILLKSIHNRCIDLFRHKKIVCKHVDFITQNETIYDFNTDNYILMSDLNGLVSDAIAKMPVKYKEAFEMSRNEGLSYHEIADRLSVSLRTVEVRISKALMFLRVELKDYLDQ